MKTLKYLILSLGILTFIGCSDNDNSSVERNNVGLFLPTPTTNKRWQQDLEELTKNLNNYHCNPSIYLSEETEEGAKVQLSQLQSALKKGLKIAVIVPNDYKVLNESGIFEQYPDCRFICHDRLIMDQEHIDFYSTCNPTECGEMQGKYLEQIIKKTPSTITLTIEIFGGPTQDPNSQMFYNGAMTYLRPYLDNHTIYSKSGLIEFNNVSLNDWNSTTAEIEMNKRLSYYSKSHPDLILAPNDGVAKGCINAINSAYSIKPLTYPIITGQDNTIEAQQFIKEGYQAMTLDKNITEMAYNTALAVVGFINGTPIETDKKIFNGAVDVPVMYVSPILVEK